MEWFITGILPENSCWETSSAVSVVPFAFRKCSLSGQVIKTCHWLLVNQVIEAIFLHPIFQSINQIWVIYLKIMVWIEFCKCLLSAKKTVELCQVSLPWVSLPIGVIHGPTPQSQAREASTSAHGLKEEQHIFSELREICSWSSASIHLQENIYSHPDVQKMVLLNTGSRENALFFLQTVYVQCLDSTCTGLDAPIALEGVNWNLHLDSLDWICTTEIFLTWRSFFPRQVVPVHMPHTSKLNPAMHVPVKYPHHC